MEFANKIKQYRGHNDWTQQEVATKLGVSRKTISSWETGRSYPDIFMLVQLSDLYQVSLDDLLREDHEMIHNYKEEHDALAKRNRSFTASYLINIVTSLYFLWRVLLGNEIISQLPPLGRFICGAIIGLLSFNVYYLLNRADWKGLNHTTKLGSLLTLIVVVALLTKLDFTAVPQTAYGLGTGFGHGFIVALSALSIVETIWLYPQFKQRRNR